MYLFWCEVGSMMLLPLPQLILRRRQISQAAFPFCFQSAGDQTILRFDSTVTPLHTLGFVTCAFHLQPPLLESGVAISLELLECEQRRIDGGRSDGLQERMGHGLIDAYTTDAEAVNSASFDKILARAVIARR